MTRAKALLLFLGLVAAGVVYAAAGDLPLGGQGRRWTEFQAVTRAAPTLATEGMSLVNVAGYRVGVCANATNDAGGYALLGVGTIAAYYWDPYGDAGATAWHRDPSLDLTPSTAYLVCQHFPDVTTSVPYGRVLYAATGLVNDGGVGVKVSIDARTAP